jgi:hypothetical protein
MPFPLRAHENVLYPIPYDETENHPLLVTNQRIVSVGKGGPTELATSRVTFVGRSETRPLVGVAIALALLSLPLIVYGTYLVISVWGMEAAPLYDTAREWATPLLGEVTKDPDAPPEDSPPPAAPGGDDAMTQGPTVVLTTRMSGIGLGGLGALMALIALKLFRRRAYFVQCRASEGLLSLRLADKGTQTQVMVTIQSVTGR